MDPKRVAQERFENARNGPEFAQHCVTEHADKALCDGALAMAWTCIDLARRGIESLGAEWPRGGSQ